MDVRTLGVWASFTVQIASGAATVNPDYQWLAVPIFWSASMLLLICVCLWLYTNRKLIFNWVARVTAGHLLIFGLSVALIAAIYQQYRGTTPSIDPKVAQMEAQIATLSGDLAIVKNERDAKPSAAEYQGVKNLASKLEADISAAHKERDNATKERDDARRQLAEPHKLTPTSPPPLSPRAIRELLEALNESRTIFDKNIRPTIDAISSWAANSKGPLRNGNADILYADLKEKLKTQVWQKVDGLIEKYKNYEPQLQAAFVLDHEVAKNELSRTLQTVIDAVQRLPKNAPPEMDDLVEPQITALMKQSVLAWQWSTKVNSRISEMTANLNTRGTAEYETK
jgi:hypothetical protein